MIYNHAPLGLNFGLLAEGQKIICRLCKCLHRLWRASPSGLSRAFAMHDKNNATVALSGCIDGIAACPPSDGCSTHARAAHSNHQMLEQHVRHVLPQL